MERVQIESKFVDHQGEIMIVELGGYIDQSNSYQLQKLFDNIIDSHCYKVIVDFSKLYYMSSAGWGIFVGEIKRFRDNSGDIKLASMNSDIYDVYQMLEFYHILDDYMTVEDAVASFKRSNDEMIQFIDEESQSKTEIEHTGLTQPDNTQLPINELTTKPIESSTGERNQMDSEYINFKPGESTDKSAKAEYMSGVVGKEIRLADLPVNEKVKRVISQNPLIGVFGIRRILRHEHFGKVRISVFRLWKLLRSLDLDSRVKRYRYYRSC
jgi:anti-sigma B factor antagonist